MNDRELLRLAAKASGYDQSKVCIDSWFWVLDENNTWQPWNPLENDGDAFRLAVKLGIHFQGHESYPFVVAQYDLNGNNIWIKQEISDDVYVTARRAIVRAAAETGEDKQ